VKRTRSFAADPRSVRAARRFAEDVLAGESAEVLEAITLMVSELTTNSIRHAGSGFRLLIMTARAGIRVEVADSSGGNPTMRSPSPDEPSGRGLRIVDMLSDSWGVERPGATGKTVWFTLASSRVSPREQASSA
jgi:anti-sigma regulatory factor (Ser/Thr protein kinase)